MQHSHSSPGAAVFSPGSSAVCSPPLHAESPQGAGEPRLLRTSADVFSSTASVFTCRITMSPQPPCRCPSISDRKQQSACVACAGVTFGRKFVAPGSSCASVCAAYFMIPAAAAGVSNSISLRATLALWLHSKGRL